METQATADGAFDFVRGLDCCYTSSGLRLHAFQPANRSSCEASCRASPRCAFISLREKDKLCVLCSACNLRPNSGHFASWSRAPVPRPVAEIGNLLQGNYSVSLYGAEGRVDVASLLALGGARAWVRWDLGSELSSDLVDQIASAAAGSFARLAGSQTSSE